MSPWGQRANEDPSWISNMIETQGKGKGKGVSASLNLQKEPEGEVKFTSQWEKNACAEAVLNPGPVFLKFCQNSEPGRSVHGGNNSSSLGGSHSGSSTRAGERRRTKAETTISLEVLRQYFAGNLKDAAKSLGVCPTTLKRICRQHGINRWPSRKIKKVGHSLKKLQHVIDSVQGAEGTIQLDSFYAGFPELDPNLSSGGTTISPRKQPVPDNPSSQNPTSNMNHNTQVLSFGATTASQSPSSCSQSSTSTTSCSTGAKQDTSTINLLTEDIGKVLKQVHSDAKLHVSSREESKLKKKLIVRSQSHRLFGESIPTDETPVAPNLPRAGANGLLDSVDGSLCRVKATYGKQKIQFTLQSSWGFRELQGEIARQFGIDDLSMIDIKYLDDDCEWILLTCDADLEECIDVYRTSLLGHTIRISLHQALKPDLNHSLWSRGQSQIRHRSL